MLMIIHVRCDRGLQSWQVRTGAVKAHMSVSCAAESSSKLYEKPEQPPGSTLSLSMPSSPSWASS